MFDIYREGDVVWAQDYHLMLLPAMLKKQHPKMKVVVVVLPADWLHLMLHTLPAVLSARSARIASLFLLCISKAVAAVHTFPGVSLTRCTALLLLTHQQSQFVQQS